jgi:arylsulfatase A-like enzyme
MESRRDFLARAYALPAVAAGAPPNVVVIFADDLGYADLGSYGAKDFQTPRLDRMAAEGMRFTDFYSAAPICTPSRAALLTGCYPKRVGLTKVLGEKATNGIGPGEKLLPEILREQDYRTAIYGKWHLGLRRQFLPLQHGFDEFVGTPASNDMGPNMDLEMRRRGKAGVQWMVGNDVVETDPDQSQLTQRYTRLATDFIRRNRANPFFLYLAHNMPHTPLFAGSRFLGKSKRGLYGDVVEELDWSVGEVLDCLKREGLDERTLVIFTSDNGPWLIFGDHGGSAAPLRGGKKQSFDGGLRVPAVFRWPKQIPAGRVSREVAVNFDILPTVAGLAGGKLPSRAIDGRDLWPLLSGARGARSPHEAFYYFYEDELRAVRSGRWKLQLPHTDKQAPDLARVGNGGVRGEVLEETHGAALYDLSQDPGESRDLSARHPDVVQHLTALARRAGEEIQVQSR